MLSLLVLLFIVGVTLKPPEFQTCKKGEVSARCACPADSKYIGKRNIILVDVTTEMPKGKIQDIIRIISETALREMGLLEWFESEKKIEKTSVYLLSDKKPTDMEPIESYCTLPPAVTWLVSDFSENEERKIIQGARDDIVNSIDKIESQKSVNNSNIVESLAVLTSNSDNWISGSKLTIVSDLYENSTSCGYFDKNPIPTFQKVSSQCKKLVNILGQNLTKNSAQNGLSSVVACHILYKPPKDGLIAFWKDLFQSELNYDVLFSCDPNEINQRIKRLN
jgi:hypothetical protein